MTGSEAVQGGNRFSKRDLSLGLAAFVVGFLLVLPFFYHFDVGLDDEAIAVLPALRILDGEVPYRDFTVRQNPASAYGLAFFYLIFGASLFTTRLFMAVLAGAMSTGIWLLSRQLLPERWAALPVVLFVTTGITHFAMVNHHWVSNLALLYALIVLLIYVGAPTLRMAAGLGAMVALTWWSLQSDGGALGIAVILTGLGLRPSPFLKHILALSGGFFAASLVLWLPIWLTSSPAVIFDETVLEPVRHHVVFNLVPYSWDGLFNYWTGLKSQWPGWPLSGPQWAWLFNALIFQAVMWVKYGFFYVVLLLAAGWGVRKRKELPREAVVFFVAFLVINAVQMKTQNFLYLNYLNGLWYPILAWTLRNTPGAKYLAAALGGLFVTHYLFGLSDSRNYRYPIRTPFGTYQTNSIETAKYYGYLYGRMAQLTPPGSQTVVFPYAASLMVNSRTKNAVRPPILLPGAYPERDLEQAVVQVETKKLPILYYRPLRPEALTTNPNVDVEGYMATQKNWGERMLKNYTLLEKVGDCQIYQRNPDQ